MWEFTVHFVSQQELAEVYIGTYDIENGAVIFVNKDKSEETLIPLHRIHSIKIRKCS